MKRLILLPLLTASLLAGRGTAAETEPKADPQAAAKSAAKTELDRLIAQINAKIKGGRRAAGDFADEIKQFDALLARHQGEKGEDISRIAFMKATLFLEVFKDEAAGTELLRQLAKDFPETRYGRNAESRLKATAAQAHLAVGKVFPGFSETGLDGKPLATADYKGKVVLVDFWATWCGPCVGELPNVRRTYEKFHPKGFEIVGISLDEDKERLQGFLTKNDLPWRQFFDGQGWQNKLAQQYGVKSIPATFLLDGGGRIIAKDLRGEQLEAAVAGALEKKP